MKLTPIFRHIILPAFFLPAFLPVGCSADRGDFMPEAERLELDLALNINVLMPSQSREAATRAGEPNFELPDFPQESLNSLRVIIVKADSKEVVHNRTILFENGKPVADDLRFKVTTSSLYSLYLLGNCKGKDYEFGPSVIPVGSIYSEDGANSIENAMLMASGPLFNNSGNEKEDIPLTEKFRIQTVAANGDAEQVQEVDLFITRSAAKFSFKIETSEDFPEDFIRHLTSIKISGIADKSYLLPNATVYNPTKYSVSSNPYSGRDITAFRSPEETNIQEIIYSLPEPLSLPTSGYEWNPEIYLAESQIPEDGFLCTLSFDNGEEWLSSVKLPNLPYGMPRNTHAKVEITLTGNRLFSATLKVLPWNTVVTDFDYSDQVGMASDGALAFTAGTYLGLNKQTGHLVLDYPKPTQGAFGISTPKGMRWDAYLITTGGTPDAIRFLMDDGTTSTHISGNINGSKTNFSITSANPPGSKANSAVLQVIVTTADGRGIPVNILKGGGYGSGIENITIIQNPK